MLTGIPIFIHFRYRSLFQTLRYMPGLVPCVPSNRQTACEDRLPAGPIRESRPAPGFFSRTHPPRTEARRRPLSAIQRGLKRHILEPIYPVSPPNGEHFAVSGNNGHIFLRMRHSFPIKKVKRSTYRAYWGGTHG